MAQQVNRKKIAYRQKMAVRYLGRRNKYERDNKRKK